MGSSNLTLVEKKYQIIYSFIKFPIKTLQNKLLKHMLKLDQRTSTNQVNRDLSLLKVSVAPFTNMV